MGEDEKKLSTSSVARTEAGILSPGAKVIFPSSKCFVVSFFSSEQAAKGVPTSSPVQTSTDATMRFIIKESFCMMFILLIDMVEIAQLPRLELSWSKGT